MKSSINLEELAEIIKKVSITTRAEYMVVTEIVSRIDEQAFKSSRIESRYDFNKMCGLGKTQPTGMN